MSPSNAKVERYAVDRLAREFLDYFRSKGHEVVRSAPLLPEDPTLLFTAAGMVPFKAYYSDPSSAPYTRATSVQKCLRAGGKQSDLENVGRTLRHHTFFEMLGNFSFGDYFKKEAIDWGWELSIDVWNLDRKRIWLSVYQDDDEAFELWRKRTGMPPDRILRMGKEDNFWGPVGETGVCGPSSEMYFDVLGKDDGAKPGDPGTDDRFIEYWNLVFPQFFYTEAGKYERLPKPGIDTGLGLERIAFILQEAPDNYHTDEFIPIRAAVARAIVDEKTRREATVAINVAADHVRALTFALTEGIMPSNEGRGYVLRRLLRRALTKMQPFGVKEPFLAAGVDAVVATMSKRYPELAGRGRLVGEIITAEEERFLSTLEQGMDKMGSIVERAVGAGRKAIDGRDAFLLYDTYGFPLELTEELAEEKGLVVERGGFDAAMTEQRERARRASFHTSALGGRFVEVEKGGPVAPTEFIGYDALSCEASVVAYGLAEKSEGNDAGEAGVEFVTDRTVFYAESGGQVGDTGTAVIGGVKLEVIDARHQGERIVHRAVSPNGSIDLLRDLFARHREVTLAVDRAKRLATMRNHTATHLLHASLRRVLGDHAAQAGSLVAPDRLRFDFHHFQAMREEEIETVERLVNEAILADHVVTKRLLPYDQAVAEGAMALFGEKYGDTVRMVTVEGVSRELCGGTHLDRTGEIGAFLIRQESAVGAGVRRVEAMTGLGAFDYVKRLVRERRAVAEALKVAPEDVERRVHALVEETEALQRRIKRDESHRARDSAADAVSQAADIGGVKFVSLTVDVADVAALRKYGDELRDRLGLGVGVLCQNRADKPVVLIVASDSLITERSITATDITKRIAEELSYRGGGKPHMAQVGLPTLSEFDRVRDFVRGVIENRL